MSADVFIEFVDYDSVSNLLCRLERHVRDCFGGPDIRDLNRAKDFKFIAQINEIVGVLDDAKMGPMTPIKPIDNGRVQHENAHGGVWV